MKRAKLIALICIFLIAVSIPVNVYACGGFVALRNEKIFHSVYCERIHFADYKSLIWFNEAKDAEVWGYEMCEECSIHHDYGYKSDWCDFYIFETDDPLMRTAMERSFEIGFEAGHESGKESMHEEVNWAYEDGYDDGYEQGRYVGREAAEEEYISEQQYVKEQRRQSWESLFGIAGLLVIVTYVFDWLDKRKTKHKNVSDSQMKETKQSNSQHSTETEEKQKIRKQIAELKIELAESDKVYAKNKKILSDAFTDKDLEVMVKNGEFTKEQVNDYVVQRENLRAILKHMPSTRAMTVELINDLSKQLAELEHK